MSAGLRERWGGAAAAAAVLDLLAVHQDLNRSVPGALVRGTPESASVLRSDGAARLYGFDHLLRPAGAPAIGPGETPELARASSLLAVLGTLCAARRRKGRR